MNGATEWTEARWQAQWRRRLTLGLAVAFATPLFAMGVAVAVALAVANGSPKFLGGFGGLAAVCIVLLRRFNRDSVSYVAVVPIAVAVFAFLPDAVDEYTLERRGKEASCVVRDIDRRVETSTSTDANGHTSTTTTVHYDHRLDCLGGGPGEMTLGSRAADVGESIVVAYDPHKSVAPRPAAGVHSSRDIVWVVVLTGTAIAVRLVVVGGRAVTAKRGHRPVPVRD